MRVREEMSTETAVRDPKWNPIKGDAFEKGHIRREVEGLMQPAGYHGQSFVCAAVRCREVSARRGNWNRNVCPFLNQFRRWTAKAVVVKRGE